MLSLDSERSDGSSYSATDSMTGPAPALLPEPTFAPSLFREGPFTAATPTLGLGVTGVVVPTGSRPPWSVILLSRMATLVYIFICLRIILVSKDLLKIILNGLYMEFCIDCIHFEPIYMRSGPLLFFAFMDVMILHISTSSVGNINIDQAL